MRPVKGWTMAGIALAVGVGTYTLLKIVAPHRQPEPQLEGLASTDAVFGDTAEPRSIAATAAEKSAAEAPAAAQAPAPTPAPTPTPTPEPAATPPPPAPAPAPAAAVATADTAVKPESKPTLPVQPEPKTPQPKPEPKASPKPEPSPAKAPDAAKPAAAASTKAPEPKPAAKKSAPAKPAAKPAPEPATAWWASTPSAGGFQVLYVGSASFRRAVVVLTNGAPVDVESANRHLAVLDGSGRPVGGSWEISSANAGMLIFPLTAAGRYELIVGGQLGDRQARTLGQTLRGPVQIQ